MSVNSPNPQHLNRKKKKKKKKYIHPIWNIPILNRSSCRGTRWKRVIYQSFLLKLVNPRKKVLRASPVQKKKENEKGVISER